MTEFKCEACGEVFEKPPNRVCPKCGEDRKMVMYRLWKLKQGNQ